MSHTPGEWTYDADQLWTDEHNAIVKESVPDYQNAYPVILVRSGGFFVADCGCNEYTEANARLIAAAPNLLEACEELEEMVVWMRQAAETGSKVAAVWKKERPKLLRARVAIAKAKGAEK